MPAMTATHARSLSAAERADWLRLIRCENVGPITFFRLIDRFGSAGAALSALPDLARRGGAREIKIVSRDAAEDEIARTESIGGRVVTWGEPDYPPLLARIEDPPPTLAVVGDPSFLSKRAIAVVGARNASIAGKRFAAGLARDLGQAGLLVVSGMARGIDAAAHEGALPTGTVAVLGGGVDVVYPRENAALYDSIRERGALISEVAAGTEPQARHFPRRNRIIAGMCRGVVVVEASPKSGSLITARLAVEQGREVFAVPGAAMDPRARGTNGLIRQGAVLTESAEDVLATLSGGLSDPLADPARDTPEPGPEAPPSPEALEAARPQILAGLGVSALEVDEIIRNCQFSPAIVATLLLELELAGRLERHPGNRVSLLPGPSDAN